MFTKDGVKTSEFWMTALAIGAAVLLFTGVVPAENRAAARDLAWSITGASGLYAVGRGLAKRKA